MDGYTAQYERIAPQAYFQMPNGDVCPIINKVVAIPANSNNFEVIPHITGYDIMIVGGRIVSDANLTVVDFINGSGGAGVRRFVCPARAGNPDPNIPLVIDHRSDIFKTSTGVGLYANSSNDSQVVASFSYITFKPAGT